MKLALRGVALTILGMVFVVFIFQLVACVASASAQPVPGPTGGAATATEAGWSLVETYGPVWGGMALAFALASTLLKRNESTHWIARGRTLAIIVAAVGTGTAALTAKFAGTPWPGVLVTAVVSLFKLLQPTVDVQAPPAQIAIPPRAPEAGRVDPEVMAGFAVLALATVAFFAFLILALACTGEQRSAFAKGMWQCTDPIRADAVDAITPAVTSAIRAGASADGKRIDLATVKSAITKANLYSEAGILLSCAAANAFAILSKPAAAPAAGAPASSEFVLDPAAVRDTWAKIDVELFGGARFQTANGVQ